jgi:hypothetical protein
LHRSWLLLGQWTQSSRLCSAAYFSARVCLLFHEHIQIGLGLAQVKFIGKPGFQGFLVAKILLLNM